MAYMSQHSKPETPSNQAVNQIHGSMVEGQAMPPEKHLKPPNSKANNGVYIYL